MKYRAVLDIPGGDVKIQQIITEHIEQLKPWIDRQLLDNPKGRIVVYRCQEIQISEILGAERINICECSHPLEYHRLTCTTGDNRYGSCNVCSCKRFVVY